MLMTCNKVGFGLMEVAQRDSPKVTPNWKHSKRCRNNITNTLGKARETEKFFGAYCPVQVISPCNNAEDVLPPPKFQVSPLRLVEFFFSQPFHRFVGAKNMIPPIHCQTKVVMPHPVF